MKDWLCKPTSLEEAKEIIERAVANGAKLVEKPTAAESSDTPDEYHWNLCDSWGVIEGETYTSDHSDCYDDETLTIEQVREQFPLPNEKSVKWEDLKPNSIEWLEFAKSIGATHWHESEMKFAKAGDGHSCMMFGNSGWEINTDFTCPSTYSKYWKSSLIDYSLLESKTGDVVCSISETTTWDGQGLPHDGSYWDYHRNPCDELFRPIQPIKSDRERWIDDAIEVMKEVHTTRNDTDASPEQKCRLYAEAIYDKLVKQK